ncbi:MAG: glutamate 5-kinase [Paracoccaceae bacterium]
MEALSSTATIGAAKRVVIKIGSALLVDAGTGALRQDWLAALACDVAMLRQQGAEVLIVSSGSIALGRQVLGFGRGALSLERAQAAAAVGQIRLARAYQEVLTPHEIEAAQILLTLEDTQNRRRYLNSRATINTLLELGTVPIVNENDTVATDEIRYGDNDRLAAQVAAMVGADVLVLLSDVAGLYSADPRINPAAEFLPQVAAITPEIEAMAGGAGSEAASGGMRTKIMAAKVAMHAGCTMVITKGAPTRPIQALLDGGKATWFAPAIAPGLARKRWISGMKPNGRIMLDAGAARALMQGKSLLPAGVLAVEGTFDRGEAVEILGPDGAVIAKALAGYSADDGRAIMGCQSHEIAARLGHAGRAVMVHRDDMAM